MAESKDILLGKLRGGEPLDLSRQIRLTLLLGIPAILAQVSSVAMQYIDSAMVGALGANPSASIGLVSTSTWIMNGFAMAVSSGFSVQVAHFCGSRDFKGARSIMRQGLFSMLVFTSLLAAVGVAISGPLPVWLGGGEEIVSDASSYFLIFCAFMPVGCTGWAASGMLQASGNMKVTSLTYIAMCGLDVVFNYIFIYMLGMGVPGAALGTGLAEVVATVFLLWYIFTRSKELAIKGERGSFIPQRKTLRNALGITSPMWLQNIIMRGAYVMSTLIVAPLGAVAIAANSFAITAESFCYMPGYGLEEAATTLVGQSIGAGRKEDARRFAYIAVSLGAAMMTTLAVFMFFGSTFLMDMLSNDPDVIALGSKCLRIEAFAELMYAVSMVAYGAFVGAGDTLVPSIMNFVSMWLVRIGLALVLTPKFGLTGYWIAMCVELNVRGLLFLWRLRSRKWMKKRIATT